AARLLVELGPEEQARELPVDLLEALLDEQRRALRPEHPLEQPAEQLDLALADGLLGGDVRDRGRLELLEPRDDLRRERVELRVGGEVGLVVDDTRLDLLLEQAE